MGNSTSSIVPKKSFGSIYGKNGVIRPGYYWTKNNNKLIYKGEEIPLLLNETDFKSLKYGYLVTNLRVFYKGEQIPEANPKTFSTVTRNNVKKLTTSSKKNEKLVKLNTVLGMDFMGDKKRIYYKNKIIYEE